jgi:TPR repeat protein
MNSRGDDYYYGRNNFPQDDVKAVQWYTKAAEQGNAQAEANLGFMYEKGRGELPKNDAEAVRWYLGLMYEKGRGGLAKNQRKRSGGSPRRLSRATLRAKPTWASWSENGLGGLAKDEAEAVRWYTEAAQQGDLPAQRSLTRLHRTW